MTIEILEKRRRNNIESFELYLWDKCVDVLDVMNSAGRGYYKSMIYLHHLYHEGWYIPLNGYEAITWFLEIKNCNLNVEYTYYDISDVYCDIGFIYFLGDGVEKNFGKAVWWFKRAADFGNCEAMYMLGQIYIHSKNKPKEIWFVRDDEIFKNFRAAFYWFNRCFEDCDRNLRGKLYLYGIGVEKNEEKSFELFVESVQSLNYSDKMYELGKKYIYGKEKNFEKGIYWLKRATDHLNDEAAILLSKIYFEGEITEFDLNESAFWLSKITNADNFDVELAYKIADKYFLGKDVKKNVEIAIYWYKKLAEAGNIEAIYKLGEIYRYGQGVEKNLSEAVKWLDMAYQKMHG